MMHPRSPRRRSHVDSESAWVEEGVLRGCSTSTAVLPACSPLPIEGSLPQVAAVARCTPFHTWESAWTACCCLSRTQLIPNTTLSLCASFCAADRSFIGIVWIHSPVGAPSDFVARPTTLLHILFLTPVARRITGNP